MERQKKAQNMDKDTIESLKRQQIGFHASELVKFIESYAISHAITMYKKNRKDQVHGNIRWKVDTSKSLMIFEIYLGQIKYMIKTEFGQYNITGDVCEAASKSFIFGSHHWKWRIQITFSLEAVL
jgi:hypothetical protein